MIKYPVLLVVSQNSNVQPSLAKPSPPDAKKHSHSGDGRIRRHKENVGGSDWTSIPKEP